MPDAYEAVPTRLLPFGRRYLRITADPCDIPPLVEDAVGQLVDILRDAVSRRHLSSELIFTEIKDFYGEFVAAFDWPPIGASRLSTMLAKAGLERGLRRQYINGLEKRTTVFRLKIDRQDYEDRIAA